ncbi:hypothetical protein MJO29_016925 [Puccinia striiformis f. sp. tritici]|uniref:hypothetical protein n=1 Tax=Puccinia striiformis f. sp. tritici TaxID=168172 RepID=UPI000A129ADB|nr:hypothetical protein Pst134EA_033129 [Puccinia striiformis f. sp. tritici]KAH9452006.1 hypothetical protein Pst134EA_033129 [Puccinia striiformis f. sp. tritici]KAI7933290.1 hypothetical protein MJO29_016925 [Puccinia striiformis f. sp. tritici]
MEAVLDQLRLNSSSTETGNGQQEPLLTKEIPEHQEELVQHLNELFNKLFPENNHELAQQNLTYINQLIDYLQSIRNTHPIWNNGLDELILKPHLDRILNLTLPTGTTKKRNSSTLAHKLQVIDYHHQTKSTQKQTAIRFGLTQSQLSRWLKEEDELRNYLLDNGSDTKRQRTGDFPQIEDALLRFYLEFQNKNDGKNPTDEVLKNHTKQFITLFKIPENLLKVSNGWLLRFKARNNLKSYKLPCLPATLTCLENEGRLDTTRTTIQSFTDAYHHRDVYVMGDIELFCNLAATFTGSIEVNPEERNRIQYVICTNGDGSDKREPLIIGSHQDPQTFSTDNGEHPKSYWYRYATRPKNSSSIFAEWIKKFDRDMYRQKRKVTLLMENPNKLLCDLDSLVNTTIVPLPHLTKQFINPLLAGINRTFKSNYRRNLLEFHTTTHTDTTPLKTPHDQLIAIQSANSAWEEISPTTISNCFLHVQIISNPHPPLPLNHNLQFVSDLDMEKSLMATQSALIQVQRDLNLGESNSLSIDQFLELESFLSISGVVLQNHGPNEMATDFEIVNEALFTSNQLVQELQLSRVKEDLLHKTDQDDLVVPSSSSSPLIGENSNPVSKRTIKARPKRKSNKLLEPQDLNPVIHSSGSNQNPQILNHVPLSIPEIMNCLNRLEFSLPFYLSSSPNHPLLTNPTSSNPCQLSGPSSSELPTLPSGSSGGNSCLFVRQLHSNLNLADPNQLLHHNCSSNSNQSNLSELPILSSSASATQNQNQTTHLNEELINLDISVPVDIQNQSTIDKNLDEGQGIFDLNSSVLLDQISDTLNQHQSAHSNNTVTENIHVLDQSSPAQTHLNLHSPNLSDGHHSLLDTQLSNIRNLKEILGQKFA